MLLKTVLGPFWVWLVVGETPGLLGFIGRAIVVAALIYFLAKQKVSPVNLSQKRIYLNPLISFSEI
jgi:hypothetical protein